MKAEEICRKCQHWKHTMTICTGEGIYSKSETVFTCELKQKFTVANAAGNALNPNQGAAGHLLLGHWFQAGNQPIQAVVAPGQNIIGHPVGQPAQFAANPVAIPFAGGFAAGGGLGSWNAVNTLTLTTGMEAKWPEGEYTIPKKCPFQLEHVLHGAKFMEDDV